MAGMITPKLDTLLDESFGNFDVDGPHFGQAEEPTNNEYPAIDSTALLSPVCFQLANLYQEFPSSDVFANKDMVVCAKQIESLIISEEKLK